MNYLIAATSLTALVVLLHIENQRHSSKKLPKTESESGNTFEVYDADFLTSLLKAQEEFQEIRAQFLEEEVPVEQGFSDLKLQADLDLTGMNDSGAGIFSSDLVEYTPDSGSSIFDSPELVNTPKAGTSYLTLEPVSQENEKVKPSKKKRLG